MSLFKEAGFPAGVVNMLNGPGSVGEMISRHPGIAKVSFASVWGAVSWGVAGIAGEIPRKNNGGGEQLVVTHNHS